MTKLEFMKELESLLLDIPLEEREEALRYYNGYFEDAGEENEEEVAKELGSPKRVAATIKADLNSNAADRENRGYFTENGFQDTSYIEEKYEVVGTPRKVSDNDNQADGTNGANSTGGSRKQYYNQGTGKGTAQDKQQKNYKRNTNIGLIILICIFAIPVGLPLLFSAFGIFIAVFATIFGLIIALGAAGIAMTFGGIALFVIGLVKMGIPLLGLLLCGSGLLVFGIGMLLSLLCGLICKTLLPAIVKGVVNLCRLPFKNRSVMA